MWIDQIEQLRYQVNRNSQFAIVIAILAIVMAFGSSAAAQTAVYKEISKTDQGAKLAADFAVKEQSAKTKSSVTLTSINKAEDHERNFNRNFRLCLGVSADGRPVYAQAIVSMDKYSNLKLLSWKNTDCEDFAVVSRSDPGIGAAADFAVKKHSEDSKTMHTLAEILKGENKGIFSMTYRICMRVAEGKETRVIQAVVTMDQYSNYKLVSWKHSACGN